MQLKNNRPDKYVQNARKNQRHGVTKYFKILKKCTKMSFRIQCCFHLSLAICYSSTLCPYTTLVAVHSMLLHLS